MNGHGILGTALTFPLADRPLSMSSPPKPKSNPQSSYTARSPLRYPGGKTRAVKQITQYFPKNIDALLSPFFGGGSIELTLAAQGLTVYGYDAFGPLVEFWQCLSNHPQALADKVKQYFPLTKTDFYWLQKNHDRFSSQLERAAAFYVLNRSSFSGSTLSGGMSPQHPRFTQSSIDRLRNFHNPNIHIAPLDFQESLKKHPNLFAYLDPPYRIKSTLYGQKGNTHKNFDHISLFQILRDRKNWVLSYNDCHEIRDLYMDFPWRSPEWVYGMSKDKESKEILIFSHDLQCLAQDS